MPIRPITITTSSGTKNRWQVDYVDQAGKRRRNNSSRTKQAAEAFLIKVGGEVQRGTHTPASATVLVSEAGELWQATGRGDGLEQSSLNQRERHLRYHILPLIGAVKLTALSVPRVRAFRDELLATPYPADFPKEALRGQKRTHDMVSRVMVSLGGLLADAQERGLIAHNAVRDLRKGRKPAGALDARHKELLQVGVDIPVPAEIKAIVGALGDDRWRPLMLTLIFTGLRSSELRGLKWADVDFVAGTITVRQRADQCRTSLARSSRRPLGARSRSRRSCSTP